MSASPQTWPVAAWMTAPAVSRLLKALDVGTVDVRFVGGAVRNAVMSLAVNEIDIGTPEVPERVMERLRAAHIKCVPTGLDHGTVMAVLDQTCFEITTLRRDTATDGRHAVVAFSTDWSEDARRRDFTFNAMSLRPDGALFDDHGGLADARAGIVRFVGDPTERIREDYLRILRLFRFFAWYGRRPLSPATLAACRAEVEGLRRLSAERVQQELMKLLAAPAPFVAVKLMEECGVLAVLLPEVSRVEQLAKLLTLETRISEPADALMRLAAILDGDGADVARRLKLSNVDAERLTALAGNAPALNARSSALDLRRALYRHGGDIVRTSLLVAWSRDEADYAPLLDAAQAWTPKTFPIGGADVLALGVAPGPEVGRLLAAAEDWWIGEDFRPGREDLLKKLRALKG